MSDVAAVDFGALTPEDEAPGVSARVAEVEGARWALVEYAPGAARPEWCADGHRGYVVAGAVEYEFDDGREPLRVLAGQAFRLPGGPPEHRGRNAGAEPARLFLIDDPAGGGA